MTVGRISEFWTSVERRLGSYATSWSLARRLGCLDKEGRYVVGATAVLIALVWLATKVDWLPGRLLLAAAGVIYIADSLIVHTSIVFVTREPINRLRSIALTFLNVLNLALVFAVFYSVERAAFKERLTAVQAVYFSFVTMTTLGYGDIVPYADVARLTVVFQLVVALYFLAVIVGVIASWAPKPVDPRSKGSE